MTISLILQRLQYLSLMALLLTLTACSSLRPGDPLQIDLAGLEPLPSQGMEVRFIMRLRVQNPNDQAIDYSGIALNLALNGQPLASGVSDANGQIPGFSESVISVPISISALSMARQAWSALGLQPGQAVPYVLTGKLSGGPFGTHRFTDEGELKWPDVSGNRQY